MVCCNNTKSEHFKDQINPYGSVECLENLILRNYLKKAVLRIKVRSSCGEIKTSFLDYFPSVGKNFIFIFEFTNHYD